MPGPNDPRLVNTPRRGPKLFGPGYQYDPLDAAAAVQQYLRERGLLGDPYNPAYGRMIGGLAAGLTPQFIYSQLQNPVGEGDAQASFAQFLDQWMQGNRPQVSGLEALKAITQARTGALQWAQQNLPNVDMDDPAAVKGIFAQLQETGAPLSTGAALAMNFTSPEDLQALYGSAMMPSLGVAGARGLMNVITPFRQSWEQGLARGALMNPETNFISLLNLLLGVGQGNPALALASGNRPGAAGSRGVGTSMFTGPRGLY